MKKLLLSLLLLTSLHCQASEFTSSVPATKSAPAMKPVHCKLFQPYFESSPEWMQAYDRYNQSAADYSNKNNKSYQADQAFSKAVADLKEFQETLRLHDNYSTSYRTIFSNYKQADFAMTDARNKLYEKSMIIENYKENAVPQENYTATIKERNNASRAYDVALNTYKKAQRILTRSNPDNISRNTLCTALTMCYNNFTITSKNQLDADVALADISETYMQDTDKLTTVQNQIVENFKQSIIKGYLQQKIAADTDSTSTISSHVKMKLDQILEIVVSCEQLRVSPTHKTEISTADAVEYVDVAIMPLVA